MKCRAICFVCLTLLLIGCSQLSASAITERLDGAAFDIDLKTEYLGSAELVATHGSGTRIFSGVASKLPESTRSRLLLVAVPGLSFHEVNEDVLQHTPHLLKLATTGAIGAMNIRTPYKGIEDSYLTIGAGGYAASKAGWGGWQSREVIGVEAGSLHRFDVRMDDSQVAPTDYITAGKLYERYTGDSVHKSQVVVPEIAAIKDINQSSQYRARPGLLGDVLQKSGIATAWFGNRDRGMVSSAMVSSAYYVQSFFHREAALMMMNSKGTIHFGVRFNNESDSNLISSPSQFLSSDPSRPFGIKTDYDLMLQHLTTVTSPAVIMLELGDLDRLYAEQELYTHRQFASLKSMILKEIDTFTGLLLAQMNNGDRLILFSPQVHKQAEADKLLFAPVIMYGSDVADGVLSSATTRRSGIVSQLDMLPTIVDSFNLQRPEGAIGYPFSVQPQAKQLTWLTNEVHEKADIYRLRPNLLYAFVTYQVIVLLIGLLVALYGRLRRTWWIATLLHSVLWAPVVLLLLDSSLAWDVGGVVVIFFALIGLGGLLLNYVRLAYALMMVSAGTVLLLLIDGIRGSVWMQQSVLGYDPMIGARYYGMGNEYMGVLIGATVLCVSLIAHFLLVRFPLVVKIGCAVLFVVIIFYLAAPNLGTNAGGAIAATVTFAMAGLRMFGGRLWEYVSWRQLVMLIVAGIVLAGVGLWLLNAGLPVGEQSHIGRAMQRLFAGDFEAIMTLIQRKISMNLHLIGVSSWSKVLLTSLLVIAVMLLRPKGYIAEMQQVMPMVFYGFSANAVGAIIALLANDSGIVAAATLIVFVAVPLLLYRIQDGVLVEQ